MEAKMTDRFYDPPVVQHPYPYYQALRRDDPVHQLQGEDVYLVTRYADCETVLAETEVFSNKAGPGLRQAELIGANTSPDDYRVVRTLLTNDPPSHTRFRKLVAPAFTARRIAGLEDKIRGVANDLIDKFPADGEIDYVRDFATPLPLIVIADFLGVPRSDLEIFGKWSDDAAEVLGGTLTPERWQACYDSLQELLGYFDQRVTDRREHPGDDFLGLLVSARDRDEQPLSTGEILAISYVTLVAGNETTVILLSVLMMLLQQNPDQLARLRADRSKIPVAVEEALQLEAPVQGFVRRVTKGNSVLGTEMQSSAGALILASSSNRDHRADAAVDGSQGRPRAHDDRTAGGSRRGRPTRLRERPCRSRGTGRDRRANRCAVADGNPLRAHHLRSSPRCRHRAGTGDFAVDAQRGHDYGGCQGRRGRVRGEARAPVAGGGVVVTVAAPARVGICECWARDGLQSWTKPIATVGKLEALRGAIAAGVTEVDATSLVPAKYAPQFTDAEEVLRALAELDLRTRVLTPNLRGVQRAAEISTGSGGIDAIGFPISASEAHNVANVKKTHSEHLPEIADMVALAHDKGLQVIAAVATAYGCPISGEVSAEAVFEIAERLIAAGVDRIMLSDTTGLADPVRVARYTGRAVADHPATGWIAHFHDTRGAGIVNTWAAVQAGADTVDCCLGGIGGEPSTVEQNHAGETGNVSTEDIVVLLERAGIDNGIDVDALVQVGAVAERVLGIPGRSQVQRTGTGLTQRRETS
jgi:hydroxymethylglutaryl-CoA lyase